MSDASGSTTNNVSGSIEMKTVPSSSFLSATKDALTLSGKVNDLL